MGDFDLSPREIRALVTFLKGLTSGKPHLAYAPAEHAEYAAPLAGSPACSQCAASCA